MKKYVNGVLMDMAPEEEAAFTEMQNSFASEQKPTMDDRMSKVEQEVEDLSYVITGEVKTNAQ